METQKNQFELKKWIDNGSIETIKAFNKIEDCIIEYNKLVNYGSVEQENYTLWIDEVQYEREVLDEEEEDEEFRYSEWEEIMNYSTEYTHQMIGLRYVSESKSDELINQLKELIAEYLNKYACGGFKASKYFEVEVSEDATSCIGCYGFYNENDFEDREDVIVEKIVIRVADHTDNEENFKNKNGSYLHAYSIVITDNDPTERKFMDNGWGSPVTRLSYNTSISAEEMFLDFINELENLIC